MPVLVRWTPDGGEAVTLRGSTVRSHPLLPDHLLVAGVEGASDPDHPDLLLVSMAVRRTDVVYVADAMILPTQATPEAAPEVDPGPPGPPGGE